jgi:hypothetical protein
MHWQSKTPERTQTAGLIIGPDTPANLREVVVMITAEGHWFAIHAMPMRDKYARLLEP